MAALPGGEVERVAQRTHVSAEDCAVPDENFPAEQSRQLLLVVEAGVVEYFPDAQSSQGAGPMDNLYCPETHAAQAPPSGPLYPLLHRQSRGESLPGGDEEFEVQFIQKLEEVARTTVENDPEGQSEQAEDMLAEYVPAGHSKQTVADDTENDPARHTLQLAMPGPWNVEKSSLDNQKCISPAKTPCQASSVPPAGISSQPIPMHEAAKSSSQYITYIQTGFIINGH